MAPTGAATTEVSLPIPFSSLFTTTFHNQFQTHVEFVVCWSEGWKILRMGMKDWVKWIGYGLNIVYGGFLFHSWMREKWGSLVLNEWAWCKVHSQIWPIWFDLAIKWFYLVFVLNLFESIQKEGFSKLKTIKNVFSFRINLVSTDLLNTCSALFCACKHIRFYKQPTNKA